MKLEDDHLIELADIAIDTAREAGEFINNFDRSQLEISYKEGGESLVHQIVTEVDYKVEALILNRLRDCTKRYDLAVLTEEQVDDGQRHIKDYFWCIDPIDGTLAFTEASPGYAVSIALVSKEGEPVIGVAYDPLADDLYSAVKDHGALKNGQTLSMNEGLLGEALTIPCDRSLTENPDFDQVIGEIKSLSAEYGVKNVSTLHLAGAVVNACNVIEHAPAVYFKSPKTSKGGGCAWDFAATACIVLEAGGVVSDFYGRELPLNMPGETYMNHCGVIYATHNNLVALIRSLKSKG